jgi:thiamine transporter ThiT
MSGVILQQRFPLHTACVFVDWLLGFSSLAMGALYSSETSVLSRSTLRHNLEIFLPVIIFRHFCFKYLN